MRNSIVVAVTLTSALGLGAGCATAQPAPGADWREAEAGVLRNHVQLTFPTQFVKAGEAYFSPDARWIIFQAVPQPPKGETPATFYSMYVAPLTFGAQGEIIGLGEVTEVSNPGSANTCGFFHPTEPGRIIFGSTIVPPVEGPDAGYQRGSNDYRWAFPEQMEVVSMIVPEIARDAAMHQPVASTPALLVDETESEATPLWTHHGYDAECAYSPDGRFIIHTRVNPETQDPDLFLYDAQSGDVIPVMEKKGYDGGPFFSADGRRITYRSDRRGDDLLQLFVLDFLVVDGPDGEPTVELFEHQVTNNEHVNWAPYWHPSGRYLVYTTSEVSHRNYEVFAIDAPRYGKIQNRMMPRKRRLTFAEGFDGMPVFSTDARLMMWTSQRGAPAPGDDRPSSQVWIAEVVDTTP